MTGEVTDSLALAPEWLDRQAYPFKSRWLELPDGRMHYVDEGAGDVLIFVHGNPSWSFEFRRLIEHLSARYRCIALDHLGFGLSAKPARASYLPQFHAAFNSWFFDVSDQTVLRLFRAIVGSAVGRWLCRRFNFFPRVLMKASFGDPSRLSSSLHAQYLAPFPDPDSRKGTWVFPRAIIGESEWLGAIWARRAALAHIPALLIWGMKDAAFAPLLPRWREAFAHHRCVLLADVSHNVAEEAAERLFAPIESFLNEEPA